ncbi:MAG: hypothetical protein KKF46_05125 [Nanoarchaeota archaeon]|nr:hypothetical protein [Nanoarchaeota archaeon]MBU1321716.1 hypothetical protein [Nanoarchaeota archaeon]MBU1597682.1 hypothetical protein [Nanoarchaeota archaeon]MBU2441018.1 hypothetical protein [Nanoarchaeota archaeon]
MKKSTKVKVYQVGAVITVFVHLVITILFFVAVPLMFVKGVISLLAAIYIFVVWIQYKILGLCFLTIIENAFLRKAGKKTHKHFVSRLFRNILNGKSSETKELPVVNAWSWHVKTIFFIISVFVIIFYFL